MAKFKVWAKSTTHYYIEVEAESEEEAREKGANADGGDFLEDEGSSSWEVTDVDEIK